MVYCYKLVYVWYWGEIHHSFENEKRSQFWYL